VGKERRLFGLGVFAFPAVRRATRIVVDMNDPTYGNAKGYRRLV
jgi:hypothetical protein